MKTVCTFVDCTPGSLSLFRRIGRALTRSRTPTGWQSLARARSVRIAKHLLHINSARQLPVVLSISGH
jgi:hypothetical protein